MDPLQGMALFRDNPFAVFQDLINDRNEWIELGSR
jgi:hypothetical protein